MRKIIISLLVLGTSSPSIAQDALEEVIVTAHPLSEGGLAQSSIVLSGDELSEKVQGSLGETLSNEAGISSASFAAAVGRPVIHGLGGARVKTTEDRIDSLDVSVTSGDHAVTIEPFIANQITVLKGASTLLYGSNAIGGVVDVDTGRIPTQLPEDNLTGKVELRRSDNADASNGVIRLDGGIGDNLAWHFDAFASDADDYEIPGFAESEAFRAAEEAEEEEHEDEGDEHEEEEEERDILTGSELENKGGAIGLSYVGDRGFAGFSLSTLESDYGLVGGHGHEEEEDEEEHEEGEEEEEGTGVIDLEQTRLDLEAQLNNPFAGIESINFRLGINDYEHAEIEGNGEIGTLFENDAWEGRIQAVHTPIAGFDGAFGLQLNNRDYSALGEEAFVPPVSTDSVGVYWVGERKFDRFDIETGFRIEQLDHKPTEAGLPNVDFTTGSASFGIVTPLNDSFTLSALFDYSNRAPTIEELYSNGPHLATSSFEIGDSDLQEESATALSVSANYQTNLLALSSTFYYMKFDDFIYEANTGEEIEELPVFVYQQNDADFIGLDAKATIHLAVIGDGDLDLNLLFDTVRGQLTSNNENLPRIPADRFGFSFVWKSANWNTRVGYLHVSEQNDIANLELATPSYDDLSLYLSRSFSIGSNNLSLFLNGRNLTDDEQRNHASIVKDFAPAPGRRYELGLRMQF